MENDGLIHCPHCTLLARAEYHWDSVEENKIRVDAFFCLYLFQKPERESIWNIGQHKEIKHDSVFLKMSVNFWVTTYKTQEPGSDSLCSANKRQSGISQQWQVYALKPPFNYVHYIRLQKADFQCNCLLRSREINHSATARLIDQPAPMQSVLASSPCRLGNRNIGRWVKTCVPAPRPRA